MKHRAPSGLAAISALASFLAGAGGAEVKPHAGAGCAAVDVFFNDEVWPKVAAQSCLKCHKTGGGAEESKFVLRDPKREQDAAQAKTMRHNRDAFAGMAKVKEGDQSRLLLKAVGKLKHEGEEALKPDSAEYRVLADFARRVNVPPAAMSAPETSADRNAPPFFDGIAMMDERRLLRRGTLSLAARLPTDAELARVKKPVAATPSSQHVSAAPPPQGALSAILDGVMNEDTFYDRLREGFNDIFLTLGADGNADQTFLSYDRFPQRHSYQKWESKDIPDESARKKAGYKMADEYRKTLHGEPLRLIEHVVRNGKPFTEIVTADYIMVSAYSARGYHDDFALARTELALREQRKRATMPLLPRQERAENMLYAAQVNSKAMQRITSFIPSPMPKARLAQQAEIALASFKAGVCVIGATDKKQFHVPLHPHTLLCDKAAGIKVRPDHLHDALRRYAGIAEHSLSEKFPPGVADQERLVGFWG